MILENRSFTRKEPTKDPKIIVIYCEGKKTEPKYFSFFSSMSSQIRLEIIPALHDGDNSPEGLYQRASADVLDDDSSKYDLDEEIDEVWFVIDTDSWGEKIGVLRDRCASNKKWLISQSNPCFKVWLYYHFKSDKPDFIGSDKSTEWKEYLNSIIPGGFDKRKHPAMIGNAMENSERNYSENEENFPDVGCTQVINLANSFYPLVKDKL
jgi:hypothetical protein